MNFDAGFKKENDPAFLGGSAAGERGKQTAGQNTFRQKGGKNMKKRLLSLLLTLVMILGMIPATAMTASAETLPEITGLHRGVLADGEDPMQIYWDAVDGVEKYEVKITQGTATEVKIVNDSCASWTKIFCEGRSIIKDETFTVEVTGGYSYGNLFVYETDTATIDIATERQPVIFWTIGNYSVVRGETYTENLWVDKKFDPDFYYAHSSMEAWDDVSGYPKFKLVDAPAWIQLWSNNQENGWFSEEVYMTFNPPADCTEGTYEFWIAAATSDVDGLLIRFKLPVGAYRGEDTQYWIQNMSIESPNDALVYWDLWKGVDAYDHLNATLIQGRTGNIYEGQTATSILKKQGSVTAGDTYEVQPLAINLQNADGQLVKINDVIDIGKYRYQYSSKTITYRDPDVWANISNDIYYDENLKVYLDGKLQDVVVMESGEYKVKSATWEFYSPWIYIYDVKPEIKSVTVNGESVADGATVTVNSKNVTIKTTYDSELSQALQDYGCTMKYKTSLNGVDYSNVTTSTSNGNGTSTQTYVQNVNSGSSLTVKSWLEVTWPDGSKDVVDERTVTVMNVDADFESISPVPTSTELTNKYTDLGTMDLGSADTNIDFKAFPKDLPAAAISDGWTTGRSISVTRDGVEIYNRTYADNELYGWNLKDNIDEGGTYLITLRVFAQKGEQIVEKTHKFRVFVKGSTIKTIALEGVGTPVIGKSPSTINTVKSNTDGVIVNKVVWTEYKQGDGGVWDWFNMSAGSKFDSGKRYAVIVEFKHEDGYNFTANKADMTVYINGQKATVNAAYSSDAFGVTLEFDPITTPEFTTQPVGGEAPYGGKYTVNWATNFTPVKVEILQYQGVKPSYLHSTLNCSATSASLEASERGYCVRAYYNDTGFVDSNKFTITETIPAFTTQPVGGEVAPGQKLTVSWATNFTPVKTVLMKVVTHPVDGTVTTRETLGTASTAEVGAGYDYYFIRAYTETSYVDSDKFYVTEEEYKTANIKTAYQIRLIEPWALRINVRITDEASNTIDYSTLKDYGMYAIRRDQLSNTELDVANMTIEDLKAEPNVIHFTMEAGTAVQSGNYVTVTFNEGLYTYRLNQDVIWALYYETDEGVFATTVKERNLYDLMYERKDSTSSTYYEAEKRVYADMVELFNRISDYRSDFTNQGDIVLQNTDTMATTDIQFTEASTDGKYGFARAQQIGLIEPWGMRLNTRIYTPDNTSGVIDYNTLKDYGVIVFHDKNGTVSAESLNEPAEFLGFANKDKTYVFSASQGTTEIAGRYAAAVFNDSIYTYELDSTIYYMFFAQDGNKFYYSQVYATNIRTLAKDRSVSSSTTYTQKEKRTYAAMVDLCDSVTAYREWYKDNID